MPYDTHTHTLLQVALPSLISARQRRCSPPRARLLGETKHTHTHTRTASRHAHIHTYRHATFSATSGGHTTQVLFITVRAQPQQRALLMRPRENTALVRPRQRERHTERQYGAPVKKYLTISKPLHPPFPTRPKFCVWPVCSNDVVHRRQALETSDQKLHHILGTTFFYSKQHGCVAHAMPSLWHGCTFQGMKTHAINFECYSKTSGKNDVSMSH